MAEWPSTAVQWTNPVGVATQAKRETARAAQVARKYRFGLLMVALMLYAAPRFGKGSR